ncbi:hypothetical protein SAMN04488567_3548 [Limimaricola pyoseonensis]|uniref:Uncharacterized protein n=2 Tax=Limimaricola pyoseonensis TaxID=521013 RepID=A0A1G7IW35_9RHOB|nr:hypothetical protein SAMN04488567_3548 [Limimaricola pyoseonensis]
MIGVGIGVGAWRRVAAAVPPAPAMLTLDALPRDGLVLDTGAAAGRDAAVLGLSGTGTPGRVVQGRARSLDDGGASSTPWADIATIDAGGDWSGALSCPRRTSWLAAEVRIRDNPAVGAQSAERFGAGHVIAIWGQSEWDRMLNPFFDGTAKAGVTHPGDVTHIYHGRSLSGSHAGTGAAGVRAVTVDAATAATADCTSAMIAMANTLSAARPGEKFAVLWQTLSGTSWEAAADDAIATRRWIDDRAVHDHAVPDGSGRVGAVIHSWFAAPGSLAEHYGAAAVPFFLGVDLSGAAVAVPGTITHTGGSYHADHTCAELYDYAHARLVPFGPHGFIEPADLDSATTLRGGGTAVRLANKQAAARSWRDTAALPALAGYFTPATFNATAVKLGHDDGAGGWTDHTHPDGGSDDGLPRLARFTALAALEGMGLAGWASPVFDNAAWQADGAYAEIWSSAGPITTNRIAGGLPPLGATFPHWTEVAGWQIDGVPAARAEIVAGRVRIYPNDGAFTDATVLSFGEGGGTGAIEWPEDARNALWRDLPLVDVGAPTVEGLPLRTLPDAALLASTVPGAAKFATTEAGPWFGSGAAGATIPAGTRQMTWYAKGRVDAFAGGTRSLFHVTGAKMDLQVLSNGALRYSLTDTAGQQVAQTTTPAGTITLGVSYEFLLAFDLAAGWLRLFVDGVQVGASAAFATTGEMDPARNMRLLHRISGDTPAGEWERLAIWIGQASADGALPGAAPHHEVTGPAATANADAWRQGAAA